MNTPQHHRRCAAYRREWARRLIARGKTPGHLVPAYGSPAWCALPESDPARIAAVVLAAEAWVWQGDPLPPLPASARGAENPAHPGGASAHPPGGDDRQGVATPGDQPQHPKPADPHGNGSATPGSGSVRGDGNSRQGDDSPRQGGHPPDDGPATPGSQGGQP